MNNEDEKKDQQASAVSPLLAGILGTAMNTSQKFETVSSAVETKKCRSCGAARPEGTDLRYCDYCGDTFI